MKIKSIKWNGRVSSRYCNGENMGHDYKYDEVAVKLNEYTNEHTVDEITEDSLTVYSIHYSSGRILRIFNPIEVLFIK